MKPAPAPAARPSPSPSPSRSAPSPSAASSADPNMPIPPNRSQERQKSEEYYDTKSSIFSALIDTIDLSQLARLDPESAREEISDVIKDRKSVV
jgi:pilus assembly protein CpaF